MFWPKSGPLSVSQAVSYLLQACEAIAEAHALGIVHRDLKPANLFLAKRTRREPIVKVLDFGISKTADAESLGLTKTSSLMGSPYYMSPEQMKSARDADTRSDIWALGIIFYELLTGVPPFQGETITEIVVLVTQGRVPPIRDLRPDVPPAVGDIIGRCLKRDPKQRYADVAEFAKALVPLGPPRSDVALENIARILGTVTLSGRPLAPEPSEANGTVKSTIAQATAAAWSNSHNESRSGLRGPLLIGIALVLVGAVTVFAWRHTSKPSQNAAASMPMSPASASPPMPSAIPMPSAPAPTEPKLPESPLALASATVGAAPSAAPSSAAVRKTPTRAVTAARPAAVPAAPAAVNRGLNMGMKE